MQSTIELSIVIVITPLLVLCAACFDPVWGRQIICTIRFNLGRIWMSGTIVAALMVLAGIEFGLLNAFISQHT
jgi:hypothetical protein